MTLSENLVGAITLHKKSENYDDVRIWQHVVLDDLDLLDKSILQNQEVDLKIIKLASRMALSFAKRGLRLNRRNISEKEIVQFANASLLNCSNMELKAVFLTNSNRLICTETLAKGDANGIAIYPREIILKCLQLSASSLYLIHISPVSKDNLWQDTYKVRAKSIREIGEKIGIELIDYYYVSAGSINKLY